MQSYGYEPRVSQKADTEVTGDLQQRQKVEHQQIPQWSQGMQPVTPEKLPVSPEKLGLERQADPQRRLERERWQIPHRGQEQELRHLEQQLNPTEPMQEWMDGSEIGR
ncbi:hypothetical protein GOODEAATRI_019927 [Goodea atripinnis]|uniref:Uncharacterized protein n=1 Tax=Goodea atripinnis TaxID=208336 RepID=A0ABV0NW41_9TELE